MAVHDRELCEKIGRLDLNGFDGEYFVARCFVLLGYVDGDYPEGKPRKVGQCKIVEGSHGAVRAYSEIK